MRARDAFDVCYEVYARAREMLDYKLSTTNLEIIGDELWRPDIRPKLSEYVADFALVGQRALRSPRLASRRVLFRVFFLGRGEYHAARRFLGISELTWADWVDEIRDRVGRELLRAGVFPPGRYFRELSRQD